MVVGGSRERTAVPRVCTQQRRKPLLGIKWKLFPLPILPCCLPVAKVRKVPFAPFLGGRR